jgi:hypothetical protein
MRKSPLIERRSNLIEVVRELVGVETCKGVWEQVHGGKDRIRSNTGYGYTKPCLDETTTIVDHLYFGAVSLSQNF